MDGTALGIAITGLLTTASSPLLLACLNARNQQNARVQQQRAELYTDAVIYAQDLDTTLWRVTEQYADNRGPRPVLQPADAITARMRLLASPDVLTAWEAMLRAQENFSFEYYNTFAPTGPVPEANEWLAKARASVKELYEVTRSALPGSAR
jgi:hypothetical protein